MNTSTTKQCRDCEEIKPFKDFHKDEKIKDGLTSYCKFCYARRSLAYYHKNHEKVSKKKEEYRKINREILNIKQKERNADKKLKILQEYCKDEIPYCFGCGIEELSVLAIDHINDDGAEHRRNMNSARLYGWLTTNNYPSGFQVLCYNCNIYKHRNQKTPSYKYKKQFTSKMRLKND